MSRSSKIDSRIVTSEADLVAWFQENCVAPEELRVGLEHEKPPYYLNTNKPVAYDGVRTIFNEMVAAGWEGGYERENLIDVNKGALNWSLEPGGQMETGGAPFKNVHDCAAETDAVLLETGVIAEKHGIGFVALGFHPTHDSKTLPTMPRSRFSYMREYAEKKTPLRGADIWWCTSTVQANLGYTSEEDMVKKLRVSLCLQPIVTALYANSPFRDGTESGYQSYRSHIMNRYLGDRCGSMLPVAFEKGFGFKRFVEHMVHEVPVYGVYIDGVFTPNRSEETFADFMKGELSICPGKKPNMSDWENHLNTVWPEVRLRRFLEMRGADVGSADMIKALPAFWVGILYDQKSLNAVYKMTESWTDSDRAYLREMVPEQGLQTKIFGRNVQDVAAAVLTVAEAGLQRRGLGEQEYLGPLREIAWKGENNAQRLVKNFRKEWKGDIKQVYNEQRYRVNTFQKPARSLKHSQG